MSEYQLELKQIVDYPRCRIYRQFIRTLMEDRSIRVSGGSGLFNFTVFSSYSNFRTSYKNIDGINYTVRPGEWICRVSDIASWFRVRFQRQALDILDNLQTQHYITYSRLGRGNIIKFKVTDWRKHNTVLEYNAPCQKDTGFFFLPVSVAAELVSIGRCSEADIILDLWVNTVYNDPQVQGSDAGPVVYLRNGTGRPLLGYAELAERWGIGKSTAGRILKKLAHQEYLTLIPFSGKHGSIVYLNSYLSTMFQISDVMIDKDEIAMELSINASFVETSADDGNAISDEQLCVSKDFACVPKSHIRRIVAKVAKVLAAQGVSCCECRKSSYMLSPLSDCGEGNLNSEDYINPDSKTRFTLAIYCGENEAFLFELSLCRIAIVTRRNYRES